MVVVTVQGAPLRSFFRFAGSKSNALYTIPVLFLALFLLYSAMNAVPRRPDVIYGVDVPLNCGFATSGVVI